MLTKGYITDLPKFNNKYKVRIPVFETAGIGNTKSVFNASVIEATLVYTPGIIDNISIGDCVVIGFENDKQSKPIILGKLYCNRNLDKDLITKYTSEEEFNKFVEEVDYEISNLQKDVLKLQHIVADIVSGDVLKSITGYNATKTQTLKNINGTLTWVDDV